jgi:soluble lytic murein transglycosylase
VRIRSALLLLAAGLLPRAAGSQQTASSLAVEQAAALRLAGRPWHAAESLLAAAARGSSLDPALIVEGAEAELHARRYDRARSLLAGQPWLEDFGAGAALAVLAQAEAGLGLDSAAARHFGAARARAGGPRAALWAVRAGLAWEAAGARDSAAAAYGAARAAGLGAIAPWLRLREAAVTRDTAAAFRLLADLPAPVAREAPAARARALLAAGDSGAALEAFAAAGRPLEVARLALARGDTGRARDALYGLMARAPESDDAAAAVGVALRALRPRTAPERVALARAMRLHGAAAAARREVEAAVRAGDSSAATLLFAGELCAAAGRFRDAERAYRAASRDPALGALAIYRRARVLLRAGDPGAPEALSGFAASFPADTAAPTALYLIGDMLAERGDRRGAARWFGELVARYPQDLRASLARFRLAAEALRDSLLDSATALFQAEVAAGAPQRLGARFWLGKLAWRRGDAAAARATWLALARDDSLGYYGLRARRELALPPPQVAAAPPPPPAAAVAEGLGRLDTLLLAGLDTAADAEVRALLARAPQLDVDALLAWSAGLAARGFGPAAVRLGWQAAAKAPGDPRAVRAVFPWPGRPAVEAEAAEFGLDPLLLAALVRQESVFDAQALSPAGARGLAQLLPGTAARTARGLDVAFEPAWITVPDLNLHLGAAHLQALLRRFGGRVDAAVAAYNAGVSAVARWLARPDAADPDQFIELIPYPETRAYVRGVLRNRELYAVLYAPSTN